MPRFVLAIAALLAIAPLHAQETPPDWQNETLTGDWNGTRARWYEAGVRVELGHKLDVVSNRAGGFARGTGLLSLFEAKVQLELNRLAGWDDTSAYVHLIGNLGAKPNASYVGAAMGVNNAEVGTNTARLFHAWLQRSFLDQRLSLLVGLYPIDSEFYLTDAAGIFLHPSYGMAAEVAATGKSGPAIYPLAAFGVRIKLQPDPNWYVQLAATDGAPGHPEQPRGMHLHMRRGDGAMAIAEAGWRPSPGSAPGAEDTRAAEKYAMGMWRYNPRFDDLVDTDDAGNPARRRSHGAYLSAERTLWHEKDGTRSLAAFARYGHTDGDVSPIHWSASVGAVLGGFIAGREEDVLGVAATWARLAGKASQASVDRGNGPLDRAESVVEITYRSRFTPWLAVQPTVQRIRNPGFDPALRDATVLQLRIELVL